MRKNTKVTEANETSPFRRNKYFESLYLNGKISLELIPQGSLVGRLNAHAAGIPMFFTPTGASTAVEDGSIPIRYKEGGMSQGVAIPGNKKEGRLINGRRYILEPAIAGDVALIRAWKVDEVGNCVFRCVHAVGSSVRKDALLPILDIRQTTFRPRWQGTPSSPLLR